MPTKEAERDPSPDRKEKQSRTGGCSGSWGGLGGQRSAPAQSPKALAAALDPPPATSGAGPTRGLRHKEAVVEGDAKPLKGEIHFGHLGREAREKGREKREKERRTGPARIGAGGGGAETRAAGPARSLPTPTRVSKGCTGPPSPIPDGYGVGEGTERGVCLRLPGFGVRWVSGRGGWEGGREGRGGGPQPCRSLWRREGRNVR